MNNLLALAVMCFCLLCPDMAVSAEFSQKYRTIFIDGKIEKGDYKKFRQLVTEIFVKDMVKAQIYFYAIENKNSEIYLHGKKVNPNNISDHKKKKLEVLRSAFGGKLSSKVLNISTVNLNSPGGDALEAMMIGNSIRKGLLSTEIEEAHSGKNNHSCNSSCFFIWASGIERKANTFRSKRFLKKELGVHRVYFDPDEYGQYSGSQASNRYSSAKKAVSGFLEGMDVDKAIIEKSWKVSSKDLYFLTSKEKKLLVGTTPFYEELLISRCGSYSEKEKKMTQECKFSYPIILANRRKGDVYTYKYNGSDEEILISETRRKNILKACPSLSPTNIEQLEIGYSRIDICKNVQSSILRWEAVNSVFEITKEYPKVLGEPIDFYINALNNGRDIEQFR